MSIFKIYKKAEYCIIQETEGHDSLCQVPIGWKYIKSNMDFLWKGGMRHALISKWGGRNKFMSSVEVIKEKGGIVMEAEKYLMQLEDLMERINKKERDEKAIRTLVETAEAFQYSEEKIAALPPEGTLEEKIAICTRLAEEIKEDTEKFLTLKRTIIDQFQQLENDTYIKILFMHYVEYKPLTRVAEELGFSYSYITEIHQIALEKFYENNLCDTE